MALTAHRTRAVRRGRDATPQGDRGEEPPPRLPRGVPAIGPDRAWLRGQGFLEDALRGKPSPRTTACLSLPWVTWSVPQLRHLWHPFLALGALLLVIRGGPSLRS
jgi:hypothetical protein